MGSKTGVMKIAANRLGINFDEYMKHIEHGEKHCGECRKWKPLKFFHVDKSRGDGRASACKECRHSDGHPWRGKRLLEEHRERISSSLKEFYKSNPGPALGKPSPQLGIKRTKEQRENIRRGILKNQTYGKDNHSYIDGRTEETRLLRKDASYREWRRKVYERDNYTCQDCGDNKGGNLNAHHIKSWRDYPKLRYAVPNGVTLCKKCHIERHR